MHAVEDCMRSFVRHDVMRKARVNHAARNMITRVVCAGLEVTKQQGNLLRAVKSVRLAESMRPDEQLAHELTIVKWILRISARAPKHWPAKRALKIFDRFHGNGINHLLMKSRI